MRWQALISVKALRRERALSASSGARTACAGAHDALDRAVAAVAAIDATSAALHRALRAAAGEVTRADVLIAWRSQLAEQKVRGADALDATDAAKRALAHAEQSLAKCRAEFLKRDQQAEGAEALMRREHAVLARKKADLEAELLDETASMRAARQQQVHAAAARLSERSR